MLRLHLATPLLPLSPRGLGLRARKGARRARRARLAPPGRAPPPVVLDNDINDDILHYTTPYYSILYCILYSNILYYHIAYYTILYNETIWYTNCTMCQYLRHVL